MSHKKDHTRLIITTLSVIAIAMFFVLLRPNLTVIVFAGLTVYFANPMYIRLTQRIKTSWLAFLLTRIGILLFAIIPIVVVGGFLVSEVGEMYSDLTSSDTLDKAAVWVIDNVGEETLLSIENYFNTNVEQIKGAALNIVKRIAAMGTKIGALIGGSFVNFVTSIILYIFIVSALLTKKKSLTQEIKDIVPMDSKVIDVYIERLKLMSGSMVKSTFVVALIQGIMTGLSLWIVGVPYPLFFTCLAALLGVIPMVGAAFVAVPVSIAVMLAGNMWGGICILLFNQLIVNNVDNVIRPYLVDKKAKIDDTLLILALFGGMAYRGMMGILYGPLVMSFILTTIEVAQQKKILH